MKKLILLSLLLLLVIAGCSSAPEMMQEKKDISFLTNRVWLGMLPCADCDEIDYQLNLRKDYTFVQKFVYRGQSDEQIVDEGDWYFVSDSVIELNSIDYDKLFLISGKELIMLDEYGDRINSEFEPQYHLYKDGTSATVTKKTNPVKDKTVGKENIPLSSSYQEMFINGVDFFARGNEPNWTLQIDFEKSIVFATMDDIKVKTPAVQGIKAQDSDVTLYRAKSDEGELIITIVKDNCEDDMSGEQFTYKVHIEAKDSTDENFKTFDGCGRFLSDLRLYDIWVMESMTGFRLKREKLKNGAPKFEFNLAEDKFLGQAGCNTFSGSIDVVGNKITFGNLVGTLMSCPNMRVERAVLKAINQKTVTYSIDKLKLTLISGKTKMVFRKTD